MKKNSFAIGAYIAGGLLFCALLLIPFPVGPDRFFWQEFFDAGHVILFFIFTIFLSELFSKHKNKALIACLFSFSISVFLEALQPLTDRSWSLEDVVGGCLGILAAYIFFKNKTLGFIVFILFQFISSIPAIAAYKAIQWREKTFPVIAKFETKTETPLWRFGERKHEKSNVLKVRSDKSYPLTSYSAGHKDWSNYKNLEFRVYNPSKKTGSISIRVDDDEDCKKYENRFNTTFSLKEGWNTINIPIDDIEKTSSGRKLNTSKISKIYFFSYGKDSLNSFSLDDIELKTR